MRSSGGGELSLSACPGWGIDRQVRKKLQIPGDMPGGGGMVTGRIEPCIRWDGVEVKKWGAVQKIMHLSMLSPRVGRAGPPGKLTFKAVPWVGTLNINGATII